MFPSHWSLRNANDTLFALILRNNRRTDSVLQSLLRRPPFFAKTQRGFASSFGSIPSLSFVFIISAVKPRRMRARTRPSVFLYFRRLAFQPRRLPGLGCFFILEHPRTRAARVLYRAPRGLQGLNYTRPSRSVSNFASEVRRCSVAREQTNENSLSLSGRASPETLAVRGPAMSRLERQRQDDERDSRQEGGKEWNGHGEERSFLEISHPACAGTRVYFGKEA